MEMFLNLSEVVGQLCIDNDIYKTKTEIISATERHNVPYVQESLTWRDATSSATSKNSSAKTYKDTLSAGSVSMTRNPSLSAYFVPYKHAWYEESAMPTSLRNGSNTVQIVDDGFTAVKRTKARKGNPNLPAQC